MKAETVTIVDIADITGSIRKVLTLSNGQKLVAGDHYVSGQPGIYIAEDAIVPEKILREMWLWNDDLGKGRLGGKQGNRVKSRTFDGIQSSGLFYGAYYFESGQKIECASWNQSWLIGSDVASELGIT